MKRNLTITFGIIGALAVCAGIYGYLMWSSYAPVSYIVETPSSLNPGTTSITTINSSTGVTTQGGKTYTLEEVQKHNSETSCYSIVNNVVYDLTLWVNAHPGGAENILSMCGTDGTKSFMDEHKGRAKFMKVLDRFKIGTRI